MTTLQIYIHIFMYYYVSVITYFVINVGPPYFIEYFVAERKYIYFESLPPSCQLQILRKCLQDSSTESVFICSGDKLVAEQPNSDISHAKNKPPRSAGNKMSSSNLRSRRNNNHALTAFPRRPKNNSMQKPIKSEIQRNLQGFVPYTQNKSIYFFKENQKFPALGNSCKQV